MNIALAELAQTKYFNHLKIMPAEMGCGVPLSPVVGWIMSLKKY